MDIKINCIIVEKLQPIDSSCSLTVPNSPTSIPSSQSSSPLSSPTYQKDYEWLKELIERHFC